MNTVFCGQFTIFMSKPGKTINKTFIFKNKTFGFKNKSFILSFVQDENQLSIIGQYITNPLESEFFHEENQSSLP